MNIDRTIAITAWENPNRVSEIVDKINGNEIIKIYVKKDCQNFNEIEQLKIDHLNVSDVRTYPDEVDTEVKMKNYVISDMKKTGVKRLHMIEDGVKLLKDPEKFMNDIENLLSHLDLHSFLGTVTDDCTFVYNKYVPRLKIYIDDELKGWKEKLGIEDVIFCSHSNTSWMYFDIEHADDSELHFEESFKCIG